MQQSVCSCVLFKEEACLDSIRKQPRSVCPRDGLDTMDGDIAAVGDKRLRANPQPVAARRLRHYACWDFQYHEIVLLSDRTVSVGGGQPHGHWEEEPEGLRRMCVTWHWEGHQEKARRHERRSLQPGLWALVANDSRYNSILAALGCEGHFGCARPKVGCRNKRLWASRNACKQSSTC